MSRSLADDNLERGRRLLDLAQRKHECIQLQKALQCSDSEILAMFVFYDTFVSQYGNEVYDNIAIRFVQYLHSIDVESWHYKKACLVSEIIFSSPRTEIIDFGFGIPGAYVAKLLNRADGPTVMLVDAYESAALFAAEFLRIKSGNWRDSVQLRTRRLENRFALGRYDCMVLLDVLEHAANPSATATRLVNSAESEVEFIICLPVGEIVPVHSISWDSVRAIKRWLLDHGLRVVEEHFLEPNPNADLFARGLKGSFGEFLVRARKL